MYHYFKTAFPRNPHTEKLLVPIRKAAEEYLDTPILSLPYSKFKIVYEQGSRVEYEAVYIEHRRRLNAFTGMVLAEPDDTRWLSELEDIIWAVCDEYTWSFPKHIPEGSSTEDAVKYLDLFACETGSALSEILDLIGDRLHEDVRNRMVYELRRRIVKPFIAHKHRKYGRNNWSAVCGGSAAMTAMRVGTEEEAALCIAHTNELMDLFLESYHDDGCCLEGSLYWAYGFGYYCFYAAMLRDYTNGKTDLFQSEKVRRIAEFRQKIYLQDNYVIPFADAPHNIDFHTGLAHFLAKEYDTVTIPEEKFESLFGDDIRYRFCDFIRDFYWYDPAMTTRTLADTGDYDFKGAGWFIRKHGTFTFAAKCGSNGEPHNHNDVGSFLLFDNKKFIVDDPGWPEYTSWYFGERRLEEVCACSRGHSVPIIGGERQKRGADYKGTVLNWENSSFELDLSGAYGMEEGTLCRRFDLDGETLHLRDTFANCGGKELRDRFITRFVPQAADNHVEIEGWKITCDEPCRIEMHTETFEPRLSICKMDMKPVETLYQIDFIPEKDTTLHFTVSRM